MYIYNERVLYKIWQVCSCSLVVRMLCCKSQGPQFDSQVWICFVYAAGTMYPLLTIVSEGPAWKGKRLVSESSQTPNLSDLWLLGKNWKHTYIASNLFSDLEDLGFMSFDRTHLKTDRWHSNLPIAFGLALADNVQTTKVAFAVVELGSAVPAQIEAVLVEKIVWLAVGPGTSHL